MSQTVADALRAGVRQLQPVLKEDANRDARVLLAHVLGQEPGRLTLVLPDPLTEQQLAEYQALLKRRSNREPVSHLVGYRMFWGRKFKVSSDVLDPRPETEVIIERALKEPAHRVLDLGCGSGAILLTLLLEWPHADGVGVDLYYRAFALAADNAKCLGLTPILLRGDWFQPVHGTFDLIVSNPPYVTGEEYENLDPEVREWEPKAALTPGADGLDAYRQIARDVGQYLTPGGRFILEIGPTQAVDVCQILADSGLPDAKVFQDLDGRDRVVECRKASDNRLN